MIDLRLGRQRDSVLERLAIGFARGELSTKRGRCWSIVDLGAKNGTFVNGVPILRRRLTPGDQVDLGCDVRLAIVGTPRVRWR